VSERVDDWPSLNGALLARLRFIDFLIEHFGLVRRRHIMDYFGVSMPQASNDLAKYRLAAPDNLTYDTTVRAWLRADGFARVFP
jgi:hypothetical protein